MTDLIVPRRFCGPPDSGNGGWTAGALAALDDADAPADHCTAWPAIEVSLRQPPPLDTPLPVTSADGVATASYDGAPVATARRVDRALTEVEPVDPALAATAQASYPGLSFHPFPTCFACGTDREEGDGLRIFPGPVAAGPGHDERVAAAWTPHPSLHEDWHSYVDDQPRASVAVTWAALDCIGGWAGDLTERLMVLGRMTARLDDLPVIGEPHVAVGEPRGRDGRKTFTASTLYDAAGRVVATAEHTWIAVDPALFGGRTPAPIS
ncbi:hypothetical protein GCM10011376_00170 [Nocardioides flavus (ex Wang et al. 2016)]|uniref:Thioesterase-like superfamily protein n=1 Tax=Nocardioides flavus (ex Wang et al. 2016) TaxID=2058780 RepID=A0ABQ3HG30_9ACTN|nr:hypothetical protein [Nocardioides flavus (ex Wang et al. 2016)]GHE14834.1 hypothetical protein GCM10011376_00170 [Nocardioides flavus (ex Wang et al. 2016)]